MYPLRRVICGVDVGGTALRLAVAERRRGATVVRSLTTYPRAAKQPLAAQIVEALRVTATAPHELHLAVAGELATYRMLPFPFHTRRALAAAVPPALTTLLPFALGDGLVAHEAMARRGDRDTAGTTVCAAFARRETIPALIDDLLAAGCPVDSVLPGPLPALRIATLVCPDDPEVVFLDAAPAAPTLALLRSGSPTLLRVLRPPADPDRTSDAPAVVDELRWTLAAAAGTARPPIVLGGAPETSRALAALLRSRLNLPVVSLGDLAIAGVPEALRAKQGEYAVALGLALRGRAAGTVGHGFEVAGSSPLALAARALRHELRRTRALAAAVLALFIAHAALDWTAARVRLEHVERTIGVGLAAVSRPDAVVGSIEELRARVAALGGNCSAPAGCPRTPARGPLELLERLSRAIPENLDVTLESIEIDHGLALVEGRAASLAVVSQLRDVLAPIGDLVAPSGDEMPEGGTEVTFQLRMRMAAEQKPQRPPAAAHGGKAIDA